MGKRILAGALWYLSTVSGYSLAALILDAPREVGPIIGMVVALLVAIDPARLIWAPAPVRHATSAEPGQGRVAHAPVLETAAFTRD